MANWPSRSKLNRMLVRVNNRDHVWHNQIALVVDKKPTGFYRVELLGRRVLMPKEWLIPLDDNEPVRYNRPTEG